MTSGCRAEERESVDPDDADGRLLARYIAAGRVLLRRSPRVFRLVVRLVEASAADHPRRRAVRRERAGS